MTRSVDNFPSKIISLLPSNENFQSSSNSLSDPVNTICPTMITPTTPILESGKDKFFYRKKKRSNSEGRSTTQLRPMDKTSLSIAIKYRYQTIDIPTNKYQFFGTS